MSYDMDYAGSPERKQGVKLVLLVGALALLMLGLIAGSSKPVQPEPTPINLPPPEQTNITNVNIEINIPEPKVNMSDVVMKLDEAIYQLVLIRESLVRGVYIANDTLRVDVTAVIAKLDELLAELIATRHAIQTLTVNVTVPEINISIPDINVSVTIPELNATVTLPETLNVVIRNETLYTRVTNLDELTSWLQNIKQKLEELKSAIESLELSVNVTYTPPEIYVNVTPPEVYVNVTPPSVHVNVTVPDQLNVTVVNQIDYREYFNELKAKLDTVIASINSVENAIRNIKLEIPETLGVIIRNETLHVTIKNETLNVRVTEPVQTTPDYTPLFPWLSDIKNAIQSLEQAVRSINLVIPEPLRVIVGNETLNVRVAEPIQTLPDYTPLFPWLADIKNAIAGVEQAVRDISLTIPEPLRVVVDNIVYTSPDYTPLFPYLTDIKNAIASVETAVRNITLTIPQPLKVTVDNVVSTTPDYTPLFPWLSDIKNAINNVEQAVRGINLTIPTPLKVMVDNIVYTVPDYSTLTPWFNSILSAINSVELAVRNISLTIPDPLRVAVVNETLNARITEPVQTLPNYDPLTSWFSSIISSIRDVERAVKDISLTIPDPLNVIVKNETLNVKVTEPVQTTPDYSPLSSWFNTIISAIRDVETAVKNINVSVSLGNITLGEVTIANVPLPVTGTVHIGNTTLNVFVTNPQLDVRVVNPVTIGNATLSVTGTVTIVNETLRVEVANTPLPVTGTVTIGNQPLSVQVVNTPLDVRVTNPVTIGNTTLNVNVTNTPLPVTYSPPIRYYYSAHSGTSAVGANKVHLLLWNGGTVPLYVTRIIIASEVTGAVTGFQIVLRVQRVSAYSGGTAVTIAPFDTANPALTGVTAVTNPTVTVVHTLASLAINQEETGGDVHREWILENSPIVIRPGEGLAITQYGTAGAGNVAVTIVFYRLP